MTPMNLTGVLAGFGACVCTAAGQDVYNHFTLNPTVGIAVTSPDWEVGEHITIVGGAQSIGTVEVKFGAISSQPDGEGTLNLNFYSDQGGAPGTLLANFTAPVSLQGTGPIVVTFNLPAYSVPASFWIATRFVQTSGGIAGVRMNALAPTVGSVSTTRAFRQSGIGAWGTDIVGDWMTLHIVAAAAPCYANCDGSTIPPILNVNDFICFQTKFAAGDTTANCDGSTIPPILNVNDFTCFLNAYVAGCL